MTTSSDLHVLFAAAEFAPLARVGGLAAAAAGLVAELRRQGVRVDIVLPDYSDVALEDETQQVLAVAEWAGPAVARSGRLATIGEVTLVNVPGIERPHPYVQADGAGWPDNDRRFLAFSAAVAALAEHRQPDVLHLNDWHTASALAHLADPPPTVLTIHTLGYQGQTNRGWLHVFPNRTDDFEYYGDCNPLAGGIRCADLVIAVSPNYANEIRDVEFGFGLDQLLRDRGDSLVGILNGIDDAEWDPETDPHIVNFGATNVANRAVNKAALQQRVGLAVTSGPLFTVVTRLVHQKGVDVVARAAGFVSGLNGSLAVLGDGAEDLAVALGDAVSADPDRIAFVRGYDEALAHQMFAGGDVFVMPSRFEPCGLAQMQAMRYGALPLVTDVGGLHDTVVDIDADSLRGTGVVVAEPHAADLVDGMHRAVRAWTNVKRRAAMQRRGMTHDWSWRAPAATHIEWYRRLAAAAPTPTRRAVEDTR